MFFIQWVEAVATASGAVWRKVRCEHCRVAYVIRVEARIRHNEVEMYSRGSPAQRERAVKAAQHLLALRLKTKVDPVPCPGCYRYQSDMCKELLKRRFGWLYTAGMFLLVGGGTGVFMAITFAMEGRDFPPVFLWVLLVGGIVALLLGASAFGIKRWLWANYDPNGRIPLAKREQETRERAMTETEFARNTRTPKRYERTCKPASGATPRVPGRHAAHRGWIR